MKPKFVMPCKCEHKHVRFKGPPKHMNGKIVGMCSYPGCTCRWWEPMTNIEYLAWRFEKKHAC